jgi:hypothetical protein
VTQNIPEAVSVDGPFVSYQASDVRFWPKADICFALPNVAFGGKADMASHIARLFCDWPRDLRALVLKPVLPSPDGVSTLTASPRMQSAY